MALSRSQFAAVVGTDEKWVENAARALGRRLEYTPAEARWMGMIRLLARDLGIPVARAGELADDALRQPPETRALTLATSQDGAAALVVDLARYHSTFAAALSAAMNHGGPRRRGRRPPSRPARVRESVARAQTYGVDVSLLREALARSPAERLARLDANAAFLNALRPASDGQ
ncbi:MAG: hypothetical protein K0S86_2490 [Geminicoccaceae bacterium]|jgi:hypothetical protein|nr:hypothetical protein [Geminicoccaceae bacterium]